MVHISANLCKLEIGTTIYLGEGMNISTNVVVRNAGQMQFWVPVTTLDIGTVAAKSGWLVGVGAALAELHVPHLVVIISDVQPQWRDVELL